MTKDRATGVAVAGLILLALLGMGGVRPALGVVSSWQLGAPVVSESQSLQAGIQENWQIPLGFSRRHPDAVAAIWPEGKAVYVATRRGFLISINARVGTINWDAKPARLSQTMSRPMLYAKGQIMILANGYAKIISVASGRVLKSMPLRKAPGARPILFNGRLLLGASYGGFYGLSSSFPDTVRWAQYSRNDSFVSDPVLAKNGSVTFASTRGYVWNKDATGGTGTWKRILGAAVTAPLSTNNKLVFVPCHNDNLYAFNVANGRCPWILHLPGQLNSQAVPVGKLVLIISSTTGLYGISVATGLKVWGPVTHIKKIAAIAGNRLFAVDNHNNLRLLRIGTGRELAHIRIPTAVFYADNSAGSVVYLVTTHGQLVSVAMRQSE